MILFGNHMRTHHPLRFYNENLRHQMGGSDEKQRLLVYELSSSDDGAVENGKALSWIPI